MFVSIRTRGFATVLALCLAVPELAAQEAALPLRQAIDEALARNPELVALRRELEASEHGPAQARFLDPPMFSAQTWQWPINSLNPADANMYMFMVSQPLPGRGKRDLRAAVAETDTALAGNAIDVRARDVVERVKQAWTELYLARKTVELHHEDVALLRQLADISTTKYATGQAPQHDVLTGVVELSRLHDHLIRVEEQARLAEADLNALLDRAPDASIGPLGDLPARVPLLSSAALQQIALERQPELRAADLLIERAQAALAVADSDFKPDFALQGGYMLMPDMRDAWTAQVSITWPKAPWSKGRLDARRAQALADIEAAKARRRVTESAVRRAIQRAYVRVTTAEARAELLATSIIPQAEQALAIARAGYQTDRGDFLPLLDNQRVLLDARLEYHALLTEREQALADLERAVGAELAGRGGLGLESARER